MDEVTFYLIQSTVNKPGVVRAWEEDVFLPTYEVGEKEKNPMFFEKRVYQGSSGSVYPYPVIEKIRDEKHPKKYKALFIENYYLKLMVLPEIGGRLQMAYDKIRKRHFVYYNEVIKPALIGLTGPWISGGIEFNWPQHHRPSTFLPTEYEIEEHQNGSKTIWCNEVERMFRMKGMQGFTLYPDKAYVEINVKVYNRTSLPQTFLWWANPAVSVNDSYRSIFPPDVNALFDHGKRDVSAFPIATGVYYKHDYAPGTDISLYKNIPVPSSFMAAKSKYNFVGGYDESVESGLLHVANHHISPGKKLWTWGNGDFGKAWNRSLTDKNGPYIELMTGVYTDNQPDFTWLQPFEEKSWQQYFMPYSEVKQVKNASKDIVANFDVVDGRGEIELYASSLIKDVTVVVEDKSGNILFNEKTTLSPEVTYKGNVGLLEEKIENLSFKVLSKDNKTLLSYIHEIAEDEAIPNPAESAVNPKDIDEIEQLYLTGLHLEQYRHATLNPLDYYLEALSRDEKDVRCNNAVGLLYLRKGQFEKAQLYFEKAIETLTERNPNPYDGEPYYNLGCCLKLQSKNDEAYAAFYKSAWNAAWQDSAYFSIAQIDCMNEDWAQAGEHIKQSLIRNWHNHKGRHLKTAIMRKQGKNSDALKWIEESLAIDKFNIGCLFEKYLITDDKSVVEHIEYLLMNKHHTYIEYALDYLGAGMYEEAIRFLEIIEEKNDYPIVHYLMGYLYSRLGDVVRTEAYYKIASQKPSNKCFPNRIEEVVILKDAISKNKDDAKAYYYLGNFWYAARQYDEAIECWEKSVEIDNNFPTVLRNLSIAYYNKQDKKEEALELLKRAFELDDTDSRVFMELDQLLKKLNYSPEYRLDFLEKHLNLVEERDDLFIERISLNNLLGNYELAKDLISNRHFHPWEGGEGKVTSQYVYCRIQLAKLAIEAKEYEKALDLLKETDVYPENLGEGKLTTVHENDVEYYKGICYRNLDNEEEALFWFKKATQGVKEPTHAFYYNDDDPEKFYYQGMAWRALGDEEKAKEIFNKLIEHGEQHLKEELNIEYFAVSLPDMVVWEEDLDERNRVHCYYVMALGWLGLRNQEELNKHLGEILKIDSNFQFLR